MTFPTRMSRVDDETNHHNRSDRSSLPDRSPCRRIYDNLPVFSCKETDTIKDTVSSHRPVYAAFRTDFGDDDGVGTGIDDTASVGFNLRDNFPNPFNLSTTIGYSLAGDSHVTLIVYSVTGRIIGVIKDEYTVAGDYSVAWNAKDLPSGIYFCTLIAGNFSLTKKMLLLK